MTDPIIKVLPIEKAATTDPLNVNDHTAHGGALLENELLTHGAGRSILSAGKGVKIPQVIAGNHTLEKAVETGYTEVVNVYTDGTQIINIVRTDIAPNSPNAILMGIADNEIAKQSYNVNREKFSLVMSEPDIKVAIENNDVLAKMLKDMGGEVKVIDYSDLDKTLKDLEGMQDAMITITIPKKNEQEVLTWLANGDVKTGAGLGRGVMRRCGLL